MKINRKACFRKKSFVNFGADFFNKFFIPPTTSISPIDYSANFDEFMAQRDPEKPFCFWYGAREPHRAYEYGSSSRYGKKLTDIDSVPTYFPDNEIVRTDMLDYAVEIEYFDAHLGKILARLDSLGELENTIVIVTSDHGMPFPRVKGQMNRIAGLPGIRRPDILKSQGDPRMYGRGDIFDKYPNMCKSRMYWNRTRAGEEVPATWITPTDFDPL